MDFNGNQTVQGPKHIFSANCSKELFYQNEQIFFRVIWFIQQTKWTSWLWKRFVHFYLFISFSFFKSELLKQCKYVVIIVFSKKSKNQGISEELRIKVNKGPRLWSILTHIVHILWLYIKWENILTFTDWPNSFLSQVPSDLTKIFAFCKEKEGQVKIHFCGYQHYATNAVNWACTETEIFFNGLSCQFRSPLLFI